MAAPAAVDTSLAKPEGRFYEAEFPEVEDIVVVQVQRIVDMGAYVTLLEYDGREGMMLLSELSKRRIRSVSKLLRVGRTEICMVFRADRDKGFIDLSKRRVEPEDAKAKEESFAKAKAVHGIMRHVADTFKLDLEDFCSKFSWPLYRKYGNAFDPYRKHINGDLDVWKDIDFKAPGEDLSHLEDKIKEAIEEDLRRRLLTSMLRIAATIDVSCNEYEGIEAIKAALTKGLEASKEECEVKIKLIAHPTFVLTCMCRDKMMGVNTLNEAMDLIKAAIEEAKGEFHIRTEPAIVRGDDTKKQDDDDPGSASDSSSQNSSMGGLSPGALARLKDMGGQVPDDVDDS